MKRVLLVALVLMILLSGMIAVADDTTYTNYLLSGGSSGKKNTSHVKKTETGSAENTVTYLSRTLSENDPVITKVRRSSDGQPVTSAKEVTALGVYYMGYGSSYGQTEKKYYMKMQNTTGSPDVTISGTFKP